MRRLLLNRKGQRFTISAVGTIAISFLVAFVILGLGATILEKMKTTQTDLTAGEVNKSLTWTGNNTAISLAARLNAGSVILYNNASIVNIGSGTLANYSISGNIITLHNASNDGPSGDNNASWVVTDINASFTQQIGSDARNISDFGIVGILTIAEFGPTIAIVAIAAIVIGIILVMFGRKREPV